MNTNNQPAHPAWFRFLVGAGFLWLAEKLWRTAQMGHDLAAIGAALLGLLAGLQLLHGLGGVVKYWRHKMFERQAAKAETHHGEARWATAKETKAAKMHDKGGLFLGQLNGRDLYYPGETHLLTIAPPGGGKSVCIAVPNLLLLDGISAVIADPKLELYAIASRCLREKGYEVILLAPWAEKMSEELEMEVPDHGFNPLSVVGDGPDAKDEAELISSLLLPGKAHMNANDEFWLDGGQTILTAFILYLTSRYEFIDLPMLRRVLLQSPETLFDTLDSMECSDMFEGALHEYGGKLLGALKNAPQQFEGWMGSAQKALRIYDSMSPLGHHVSHGTIDFTSLKEKPKAIFVAMPSDRAGTHAAWLNLVISLAIELVGRDRSNRRVLFLLDEFANLGYLPNVLRGMAQYRGQGVQVWTIIQQISQLERLYGRAGMRGFLGMSEIVNTFGVWEPETLSLLSKWMGSQTVRQFGQSITPDIDGRQFGFSYQASDFGTPLMRPEDIRTMSSNEQLIFYRNLPPIRAKKVSYLERKSLRTLADPNPYYRKSHEKENTQ